MMRARLPEVQTLPCFFFHFARTAFFFVTGVRLALDDDGGG